MAKRLAVIPLILTSLSLAATATHAVAAVSYNFEVKPILAEHCFKCHGQDEKQRKAKLRLDDRANVIAAKAIIPGDHEQSEVVKRITSSDEDEVMPPPKEHGALTAAQITLLRKWIAEGAAYERHWAFIPPVAPTVPTISDAPASNPIDAFVLARLEREGLAPAQPATREEWLRRVTFDLTGLPPTLAELDNFLADTTPSAFGKVVDRLLSTRAYGEHMAVPWLDVARYADTYGRHEDHDCLTWPYRDWVVRAFNSNLPYDKFVLWQTAGDMLPNATQDMYLATAFNRLPQQSNEAGSNEEEFRQDIIADRVRTNGIAFLGLSLECARCHDHKFDPISTREYYGMAAFLNNIDECGLYTVYTKNVPAPSLFVYEGDDERLHADAKLQIAMKEAGLSSMLPQAFKRFQQWMAAKRTGLTPARPLVHLDFDTIVDEKKFLNLADPTKPGFSRLKPRLGDGHSGKGYVFKGNSTVSVPEVGRHGRTQPFSLSFWLKPAQSSKRAVILSCSRAGLDAGSMGYELLLEDDRPSFALCHFWPGNAIRIRTLKPIRLNSWSHIACSYDGSSRANGLHLYINGLPAPCEVVRDNLYKDIAYDNTFMGKDEVASAMLAMGGRHNDNSLIDCVMDEFMFWDCEITPVEVRSIAGFGLWGKPDEWFHCWLRDHDDAWRNAAADLRAARDRENEFAMRMKEVMVMRELPESRRRETHVLTRGHFEAKAERVGPDVPASVLPFPEEFPRNRLGYARWLVDRRHPLTARVFVNRVWQQFFGRGIVSTSEDFGVQGQLPTHPELLDWLSVSFMDSGWDIKALCRLIVLSETYRQSSEPKLKDGEIVDAENKFLSRGAHIRLTAEELRDNALFVSGLLDARCGGEPVKPYQPAGLWEDSGTQHEYVQSTGSDLFRRSLYTFWRRTLPPPSMTVFDAPTREFCKARREKSATPLQALVLFNDPQFLEAARVLAEKLVREHPTDDAARVQTAFRLLTGKLPDALTSNLLVKLLNESRDDFKTRPSDADAIRRKNGQSPVDDSLDPAEVAATTLMARALLGYDECVMKP